MLGLVVAATSGATAAVQIDAASTLVTAALTEGRRGSLGTFDAAAYNKARELAAKNARGGRGYPDLTDIVGLRAEK